MKKLSTPLGILALSYIIFGSIMNIWIFIAEMWPTYLYFILMGIGVLLLAINGPTQKLPKYKFWQFIIGIAPIIILFYIFY